MKVQFYEIDEDQEILTPKMLSEDPDKYGGLGMHMALSIKREIVTITLHCGAMYVSIPVSRQNVNRIVADGGVDIHADGYWCSVLSPKVSVCFKNSNEKIELLRGLF